MKGLLRFWDRQLGAMSPDERAEVARAAKQLFRDATLIFQKLGGGRKYAVGLMGWIGIQVASERSKDQFLKNLQGLANKAGEHVGALFQSF